MRAVWRAINVALPIIGIVVILGSVLFVTRLQYQILAVLAGIVMIEAGVWRMANTLIPNERRYVALREEVDRFIDLVRDLNAAAVALKEADNRKNQERFREARLRLDESVERIAFLAGKTELDLREMAQQSGEEGELRAEA